MSNTVAFSLATLIAGVVVLDLMMNWGLLVVAGRVLVDWIETLAFWR